LKLLEQDYFVIQLGQGEYCGCRIGSRVSIEQTYKFKDMDDAVSDMNILKRHDIDCEIIPVRITIKEIKKREILCYFMNPIHGNGWGFRPDEHMKFYWSIDGFPKEFAALTD